mgnify:CR=1 FL=1
MYKVKLTPYRASLGTIMHRQTKDDSLVSLDGRYKFYIDEDIEDPDFWVVQGKGLRQTASCHVAPENTIMLTTEPRSILVYPKNYLKQLVWYALARRRPSIPTCTLVQLSCHGL